MISKKSFKLPTSFGGEWLLGFGSVFFITSLLAVGMDGEQWWQDWYMIWIVAAYGAMFSFFFLLFRQIGRRFQFQGIIPELVSLVAVIGLFYAEEDWRGKHAWETFQHKWESKGEHFARQSVIPPAVPDSQNFAMAPVVVTGYIQKLTSRGQIISEGDGDSPLHFTNRLDMPITGFYANSTEPTNEDNWEKACLTDLKAWQYYYRILGRATNSFPVAALPQTPARDVLLALSRYDSTIEELRVASARPYSRFPLDYDLDNPSYMMFPHLSGLKAAALVLQLRASAELQNGDVEMSLADVKLMLRLAQSIQTEPFFISQLVRMSIVDLALRPIYEGLAEHHWSDNQLTELEGELAKLNFLAAYQLAARGELYLSTGGMIDHLRQHPEQLFLQDEEYGNDGIGVTQVLFCQILGQMFPTGWFYQNQLSFARITLEQFLPVVDVPQTVISPSKVRTTYTAVMAMHVTPYNILARLAAFSMDRTLMKFAHGQAAVDLARVAIALERYRLRHGEFPERLAVLSPAFMTAIPHDVVNGHPLHYRRTNDGQFLLYSVGWNERDDGGTVASNEFSTDRIDIKHGDWVWRYPTK